MKTRENFFLPAEELEGYEKVVPGSGKKIFQLFIRQADHRMKMEQDEMQHRHEMREKQLKEKTEQETP